MVERKKSEPVHTGPLTEAQKKLLRGYVQEYERLEDEIDVLAIDQKEILNSAKESGLDPKAIRDLIKFRKKTWEEQQQLQLFQDTVDAYADAMIHASKTDRPFAPPLEDADTAH